MTFGSSRSWLLTGFSYWFIAAILGLILRLLKSGFISGLPFTYILHTHSHIAMLGWVYLALIAGIVYLFYGEHGFKRRFFRWIFWLTQLAVIGMLFTFPFQGYGAYSIAFSTLHILVSYAFAWYLVRDRQAKTKHLNPLVRKFLAGSLVFMILSSFGPWALAYIGASGLKDTHWYEQAIYFYLHFQYNGWFTFALIGFGLYLLNPVPLTYYKKSQQWAFWSLFIATFPAYFLSLFGYKLPGLLVVLAILSGIVQLFSFLWLLSQFRGQLSTFTANIPSALRFLFYVTLVSLTAKFFLQALSIFPGLHQMAFETRDVIIGFLHLVMLGFVSSGLVFWFARLNILRQNRFFRIGVFVYLTGFIGMEALLFSQGLLFQLNSGKLNGYDWAVNFFTVVLVFGTGIFVISQLNASVKPVK